MYTPGSDDDDTVSEPESEHPASPQDKRKFIVFELCVLSLLVCLLCVWQQHVQLLPKLLVHVVWSGSTAKGVALKESGRVRCL